MQQSHWSSFIESSVNIIIGYVIAIFSQMLIFPAFGIYIPFHENLLIGLWFTVISLIRSYVIRRWFNARLHRAAQRLSGELNE